MRQLGLIIVAVLLAVTGTVSATSRSAHAVGAACWFSDSTGVIYYESGLYRSSYVHIYDTYDSRYKDIYMDLAAWRYSDDQGHCWRAYYVSTWSSDGTGGYWTAVLRTWVCGTYDSQYTNGPTWGKRQDVATSFFTHVNYLSMFVTLPSGARRLIAFGDYGTGPCSLQADNRLTQASSNTWSTTPITSPNYGMYLNYS
jgi:hypothetical protein